MDNVERGVGRRGEVAYCYLKQAELCGKVERGIGFIGIVRVLEVVGIVLDDAAEEREIVEVDGTADADGDADPEVWLLD